MMTSKKILILIFLYVGISVFVNAADSSLAVDLKKAEEDLEAKKISLTNAQNAAVLLKNEVKVSIDEANKHKDGTNKRRNEATSKLQGLNEQHSNLKINQEQLINEKAGLESQIKNINESLQEKQKLLEEVKIKGNKKIEEQEKIIGVVENSIKKNEQLVKEFDEKLKTIEETLQKNENDLNSIENEINNLARDEKNLTEIIKGYENLKVSLRTGLAKAKRNKDTNIKDLENRIKQNDENIDKNKKVLDGKRAGIRDTELKKLNLEIEIAKTKISFQTYKEKLDAAKKQYEKSEKAKTRLQGILSDVTTKQNQLVKTASIEVHKLEDKAKKLNEQLEKVNENLKRIEEQVKAVDEEKNHHEHNEEIEISKLEQKAKDSEKEVNKKEKLLEEAEKEVKNIEKEVNILEEKVKELKEEFEKLNRESSGPSFGGGGSGSAGYSNTSTSSVVENMSMNPNPNPESSSHKENLVENHDDTKTENPENTSTTKTIETTPTKTSEEPPVALKQSTTLDPKKVKTEAPTVNANEKNESKPVEQQKTNTIAGSNNVKSTSEVSSSSSTASSNQNSNKNETGNDSWPIGTITCAVCFLVLPGVGGYYKLAKKRREQVKDLKS